MPRDANDYREILQALLPPGLAWPRDDDAQLTRFLMALAEEFARVDDRAGDLVEEADPRTAVEMLPDWERVAGLPDVCSELGEPLQVRRAAVAAKLASLGGQHPGYYVEVARALGYEIAVTEFRPFTVGQAVGQPLQGRDWAFAWRVEAPETTINHFRTGRSAAGEPLRHWGNEKLECAIRPLAPAHTHVIFGYGPREA